MFLLKKMKKTWPIFLLLLAVGSANAGKVIYESPYSADSVGCTVAPNGVFNFPLSQQYRDWYDGIKEQDKAVAKEQLGEFFAKNCFHNVFGNAEWVDGKYDNIHGVDLIFRNQNQIYFHEANYRSDGVLDLNADGNHGMQLSRKWLEYALGKLDSGGNDGRSYLDKILGLGAWANYELHRTASVVTMGNDYNLQGTFYCVYDMRLVLHEQQVHEQQDWLLEYNQFPYNEIYNPPPPPPAPWGPSSSSYGPSLATLGDSTRGSIRGTETSFPPGPSNQQRK